MDSLRNNKTFVFLWWLHSGTSIYSFALFCLIVVKLRSLYVGLFFKINVTILYHSLTQITDSYPLYSIMEIERNQLRIDDTLFTFVISFFQYVKTYFFL